MLLLHRYANQILGYFCFLFIKESKIQFRKYIVLFCFFEYLQNPYHLSFIRHSNGNWKAILTSEDTELSGQAKLYF